MPTNTKLDDFSKKVTGPENYIEPLIKTIEDYRAAQQEITGVMKNIKDDIKKQRDGMLTTFMTKEIIESNEDFKSANPDYGTITSDAKKTAARTKWINSLSSEQKNKLIARYSPDMPEKYEEMSQKLKKLKEAKENEKVALKSKAEEAIHTYELLSKTHNETLKSIDAEIKEIDNKINNMNIELAKLNRVENNKDGKKIVDTTKSADAITKAIGDLTKQREDLVEKHKQLSSITEALNMEIEALKNSLAKALSKDKIFVGHYAGAGSSEKQTPNEQAPQSVGSNYGSVDTSDLTPQQKAKNMAEQFSELSDIEIEQMVDRYAYGDLQAMVRQTDKGIKGWGTRSEIRGTLADRLDALCGYKKDEEGHGIPAGLYITKGMLRELGYTDAMIENELNISLENDVKISEEGEKIPDLLEVFSNYDLKNLNKMDNGKFILLQQIMEKFKTDYLTMNDSKRVEADSIMAYLKLATLHAETKVSPTRRALARVFNTKNKKIFKFGDDFRLYADEKGKRARRDASRTKFLNDLTDTKSKEYEMDDRTSMDRGYTNGIDARDGMWDIDID